jgi:hypothetical protein
MTSSNNRPPDGARNARTRQAVGVNQDRTGLQRGSADTRATATSLVRSLTVGFTVVAVGGTAGVAWASAPHPNDDPAPTFQQQDDQPFDQGGFGQSGPAQVGGGNGLGPVVSSGGS